MNRLSDDDPVKELTWLPLDLPKHCRVILSLSPAACSPQVLALFPNRNILHLDQPTEHELSVFIDQWCLPEVDSKAMSSLSTRIPNLIVLKVLCQHVKVASGQLALRQDETKSVDSDHTVPFSLPLRMVGEDAIFDPGCFSLTQLRCISMLAISRHGLSRSCLRHAIAVLNHEDVDHTQDSAPTESELSQSAPSSHKLSWDRDCLPWEVGFDREISAIRHLTETKAHGRSMQIQLVDTIRKAVEASTFFNEAKEHLCQTLIVVLSDDMITGVPKYQVVAELPELQIQLSSFNGALPQEGPASLKGDL